MNKNLLIIFAKNPELGKVKTRLAKDIGDEQALAVYYKLLNNTRKTVALADADKAVFYDSYIDTEDEWQQNDYRKALQQGKDIGQRMYNALVLGKSFGYQKVGLIGADVYTLTADILNQAFKKLDYYEWVYGPAKDGGYYFVGCHNPIPEVFDLEAWSHDLVLKETLEKANALNLSVGLIEELNDIDTLDDLKETDLIKLLDHL